MPAPASCFEVAPPGDCPSCSWRRTPCMEDEVSQLVRAHAEAGEILLLEDAGRWVRCPQSGLFLPKAFVRPCPERTPPPAAAESAPPQGEEELLVTPPPGFASCAWRWSPEMGDKVSQDDAPYARQDQCVTLAPNGKGWFYSPESGLWLPAEFVRPKGDPCPTPPLPSPGAAPGEPASASMPTSSPHASVAGAAPSEPSFASTPPVAAEGAATPPVAARGGGASSPASTDRQAASEGPSPRPAPAAEGWGDGDSGSDSERRSRGDVAEWLVSAPACAWRRTPNMQDRVPQAEAPFLKADETVRGVARGEWVQAPNGFYLPRRSLVQCGGGDAASAAPPGAQAAASDEASPARGPAASALSPEERREPRARGVVLSWHRQGRGWEGRIEVRGAAAPQGGGPAPHGGGEEVEDALRHVFAGLLPPPQATAFERRGGTVLRVHHSEVRARPGWPALLRPGQEVEFRVGGKASAAGGALPPDAHTVEAREVTAPGGDYVSALTLPVPRIPCSAFSHRDAAGTTVSWRLEGGTLKCGEVILCSPLTVCGNGIPPELCGTYVRALRTGPLSWFCGSARLESKWGRWELSAPGLSMHSEPHCGRHPMDCAKVWSLTKASSLAQTFPVTMQGAPWPGGQYQHAPPHQLPPMGTFTGGMPYPGPQTLHAMQPQPMMPPPWHCGPMGGPGMPMGPQPVPYGVQPAPAMYAPPYSQPQQMYVEVSISRAAPPVGTPAPQGSLSIDQSTLTLRASGSFVQGKLCVALCADRNPLLRSPDKLQELAAIVGKVRHLAAEAGVPCDIGDEIELPPPRARSMDVASAAGQRPVCMEFAAGVCMGWGSECDHGIHQRLSQGARPAEEQLFAKVSQAKYWLIQNKWEEAGGHGRLRNVWEVRNPRSAELFRLTEHNLAIYNGKPSAQINAFHGTATENVISIALNGFDPSRRSGQAYGSGEYFAKDPSVSVHYCVGGRFMFLCRLHLGEEGQDKDHVWVDEWKYYVVKQRSCLFQALPLYLLEFEDEDSYRDEENSALSLKVAELAAGNWQQGDGLRERMLGARRPCVARKEAGMHVAHTTQLWLGWLQPDMSEEQLREDVRRHLDPVPVAEVVPERNAMRLGAYVTLGRALTREEYDSLSRKRYRGRFEISVDDESPQCPVRSAQPCPRLTGPSKYCRGWNLRGTGHWRTRCRFSHAPELWPTFRAAGSVRRVPVPRGTAKYDEVCGEFTGRHFDDVGCGGGRPGIVAVYEVVNPVLERLYTERKAYLERTYDGVIAERELWHGTHAASVAHVLANGLQPPSDACAGAACPRSAGKGSTSLCGNRCAHCAPHAHRWDGCHMYGLGVYLSDTPEKSHRYVRGSEEYRMDADGGYRSRSEFFEAHGEDEGTRRWEVASRRGCTVHAMLRCQTNLGSPYLIEGDLRRPDAMHDITHLCDPSNMLSCAPEGWDHRRGNSSYFVKGQGAAATTGSSVINNEYVVFQPWQVWPRYLVLYTFDPSAPADF